MPLGGREMSTRTPATEGWSLPKGKLNLCRDGGAVAAELGLARGMGGHRGGRGSKRAISASDCAAVVIIASYFCLPVLGGGPVGSPSVPSVPKSLLSQRTTRFCRTRPLVGRQVLGHAALAEFQFHQVGPEVQHDRGLLDARVDAHAEFESGRCAALNCAPLVRRHRRVHDEGLQAGGQPDVPARDLE